MILWIIAVFCGSFIKGLCGIGDAPVFTSILAFANDNIDIAPVSVLLTLPSNLLLVRKEWKSLRKDIWLPMTLIIIAGSIPGILLLKNLDTRMLKIIFGIFIVIVGIILMFNEFSQKKLKPSKTLLMIVGILAGLSCGLFGIGVLLSAYVTQTAENLKEFKANVCMVFAAENIVRMALYGILGIFTWNSVKTFLIVLPFSLLGLFVGVKSGSYLSERTGKLALIITLILSGLSITVLNL